MTNILTIIVFCFLASSAFGADPPTGTITETDCVIKVWHDNLNDLVEEPCPTRWTDELEAAIEKKTRLREEMAWLCGKQFVYREQLQAAGVSVDQPVECAALRRRFDGKRP